MLVVACVLGAFPFCAGRSMFLSITLLYRGIAMAICWLVYWLIQKTSSIGVKQETSNNIEKKNPHHTEIA